MATINSAALLSMVDADMEAVDGVIRHRLTSGIPLVGDVARYIIQAGGKRLRPKVLLLLAGVYGYTDALRHNMAAVVEFIHTATLLHDDVVDESTLRRGTPTANAKFGNSASVLVGDFLYSRAFQMMVEANSMRIMQVLADATNVIAEGEVLQLMHMHDPSLTEENYLEVIRSKTAKLFEASAQVAVLLSQGDAKQEAASVSYGQALGIAFQIVDDILDYVGDAQLLGKNVGDDLREGKTTLPLIFAMRLAAPADRTLIEQAIMEGDTRQLEKIVHIVQQSSALDKAREVAAKYVQLAQGACGIMPDNAYKAVLIQLAQSSLNRLY